MHALIQPSAAPGVEKLEMPVPSIGASNVLVAVETASACGTDLHIYHWDEWAQNRIKPPSLRGHECCGTVAAIGARHQRMKTVLIPKTNQGCLHTCDLSFA